MMGGGGGGGKDLKLSYFPFGRFLCTFCISRVSMFRHLFISQISRLLMNPKIGTNSYRLYVIC